MRIAWIDLTFTWPPRGGAGVDCFEILSRLAKVHEVCLFVPVFSFGFRRFRGEGPLPFPVKTLPFEIWSFSVPRVKSEFRRAVDEFKPDVVVVGDAWTMKPHLINAMEGYRIISRYYAYESLCLIRNGQLFRHGKFCPNHMLKNPAVCRGCALSWIAQSLLASRKGDFSQIHEFFMAGAWLPSYVFEVRSSLEVAKNIIVYNQILADILQPWRHKVVQIASGPGFDVNEKLLFGPIPPGVQDSSWFKRISDYKNRGKKIILIPGRLEDPAKGVSLARRVGKKLLQHRDDFAMVFTGSAPDAKAHEVFLGWIPGAQMPYLYRISDMVFIPSLWPEPQGIVAVEAMVFDLPILAFRVGGLGAVVEQYSRGVVLEQPTLSEVENRIQEVLNSSLTKSHVAGESQNKKFSWEPIYHDELLGKVFVEKGSDSRC